jgi:hypothetical protein
LLFSKKYLYKKENKKYLYKKEKNPQNYEIWPIKNWLTTYGRKKKHNL